MGVEHTHRHTRPPIDPGPHPHHSSPTPENLLLTHRGTDAEVRIIDFGLSKMLSNGTPQAKSFLGTRVGAVV